MNVREILNEFKKEHGIKTDEELAEKLDTKKMNIDKWIQRNILPAKWQMELQNKNVLVGINNGNMTINTSTFNHSEQVRAIIELLQYAPPFYLDQIKGKLEKFKSMTEE